jgi:hypothetical protein
MPPNRPAEPFVAAPVVAAPGPAAPDGLPASGDDSAETLLHTYAKSSVLGRPAWT